MSLVGYFENIAYDDKSASANMSTGQQKAFGVLWFLKCESCVRLWYEGCSYLIYERYDGLPNHVNGKLLPA